MVIKFVSELMALAVFCTISWTGSIAATDKIVIAHRGASGYLPEHTLEAASLAHGLGADFIEPDLVLTKDSKIIVLHDILLDSTTDVSIKYPKRKRKDGHWYAIDFTLKEIKTLNVGERRNKKTNQPSYPDRFPAEKNIFKIPTFQEFIVLIQGLNKSTGKNTGIYPEIKEPEFHIKEGYDLTKLAYELIRKHGYESMTSQIYIQCFSPKELIRLKLEFKTKIPLIQLVGENSWWPNPHADYDKMKTTEGLKKIATYADGIGPWIGQVLTQHQHGSMLTSTGLIARAQQQGLKVHPYTARKDSLPKSVPDFEKLHSIILENEKADGIFTDFPDLSQKYIQQIKVGGHHQRGSHTSNKISSL